MKAKRDKPPQTRNGKTVKFIVYSQEGNGLGENGSPVIRQVSGCFTVNTYDDGTPCELFLDIGKEGQETHGWADSWAIGISWLLQHGVPPVKIYRMFKGINFDPSGMSTLPGVTFCQSIPDMVVRYMEKNFPPTAKLEEKDSYDEVMDV